MNTTLYVPTFEVLPTAGLNPRQERVMDYLSAYEAPYLEERLLDKKIFDSNGEFDANFTEYKKFIAVVSVSDRPVSMLSSTVDEVWHNHILFTRDYMDFSKNTKGSFIHHSPHTTERRPDPDAKEHTVQLYGRLFGDMPRDIWNLLIDPCDGCGDCGSGCGSEGCGADA